MYQSFEPMWMTLPTCNFLGTAAGLVPGSDAIQGVERV